MESNDIMESKLNVYSSNIDCFESITERTYFIRTRIDDPIRKEYGELLAYYLFGVNHD